MTEAGGVPRPGGSKHRGGGGKRGARRLAVGAPLAAAALFLLLLLFSVYSFSSLSSGGGSIEDGSVQPSGGSRTAAERAAHDPSPLRSGSSGGGGHHSSWLSAAALWAQENQEQRARSRQDRYRRDPSGCGLLPCTGQRLRRPPTLIIYAYSATDAEEQRNFEHFLKHGVEEQAGLTYRFLIASGEGILPPLAMPRLPPNAEYLEAPACAGSAWGMLAAAQQQLAHDLAAAERIVVVTSAVRGPYMPPYTHEFMHWTDALTSKLGPRTKMVGSALTCEGAPKGGDAAAEWRQNPYLLPHAWAIDKASREGWQLVVRAEEVLQCYSSSWDARYHSDAGAALALLSAGYNIDTLLTKYQGMDWWIQRNWGCNARMRPDAEWTYDGVSITPYETVFVPVNLGMLQSEWSFVRQAAKYTDWAESQALGSSQGNSNEFVSKQWALRAQRMVYANSRGPGCFDFEYYVQQNADLAGQAGQHQQLWEHFVLLGQFQGRRHRFSCPLQIGNSYRLGYVRARGQRCFDHAYYATNSPDLEEAGLSKGAQLFHHYTEHGQFEQRGVRYACSDLLVGLPAGFDGQKAAGLPTDYYELANEVRWKQLVKDAGAQAEAGLARLKARQQGGGGGGEHARAAAAGQAGGGGQQQQQQQQHNAAGEQQQAAGQQAAGVGRRLEESADRLGREAALNAALLAEEASIERRQQ
ncbi:hypothetical protein COHA_007795 [Chlorella ohadii]|uniref:Uncharacterized protein n=1 Tax=Chlorella ohadii TaxID=2649997 RepID=A0AAD5DL67_9CHLO|nr:hypothetical protein COHA_007795 [Chlorella ohadii]